MIEGFFTAWTRKESLIKATGEGFSAELQSFSVVVDPRCPARLTGGRYADEDWHIYSLNLCSGYALALSVEGGAGILRVWEYGSMGVWEYGSMGVWGGVVSAMGMFWATTKGRQALCQYIAEGLRIRLDVDSRGGTSPLPTPPPQGWRGSCWKGDPSGCIQPDT